jgi:DNA-directed RNA polymerase subunit beta
LVFFTTWLANNRAAIDFIDIVPYQAFSIATSLIPFLDHDDANRALMASNMQRQAVPVITPEAPLVSTGTEELVMKQSTRLMRAAQSGTVSYVDARKIELTDAKGDVHKYYLD